MMEVLGWKSNGFFILLLPVTAVSRWMEKQQDKSYAEPHKFTIFEDFSPRVNKRWYGKKEFGIGKIGHFLFVKVHRIPGK